MGHLKRKYEWQYASSVSELWSCVKVEVAVLGLPLHVMMLDMIICYGLNRPSGAFETEI